MFPFHTTKIIHFCVLPKFRESFFDRPAIDLTIWLNESVCLSLCRFFIKLIAADTRERLSREALAR